MIKKLLFLIYTTLQRKKQLRFKRVLPFSELIVDRDKKAEFLNFGKGATIHDLSYVYGNVVVGENTWIGPYTVLDGSGGLIIGENCSISAGVQIYTHDSIQWAISGGKEKYKYDKVKIEDNCYIGPNVIIQKGVTIGKGSVVGANSFVNKSFSSNSKIAGNPAKYIKNES